MYLVSKKPESTSASKKFPGSSDEGKQGSREVRRVVVPHHNTRRARTAQCGGVAARAARVQAEVEAHAAELDGKYSQLPRHRRPPDYQWRTPIRDRLRSFGDTVPLVFGAYGEWSAAVDELLELAAASKAAKWWRLLGARNAAEYEAYCLQHFRRRLGIQVSVAAVRHRLRRLVYCGVTRAQTAAHRRLPLGADARMGLERLRDTSPTSSSPTRSAAGFTTTELRLGRPPRTDRAAER